MRRDYACLGARLNTSADNGLRAEQGNGKQIVNAGNARSFDRAVQPGGRVGSLTLVICSSAMICIGVTPASTITSLNPRLVELVT